ncbi:Ser/Thr protein kinase RdoA (MazF antagonist) [Bacillus oleivorans]|uniref:Ser/Thr protein kinase RdoA (MazF antagonist) n=1 Tax=Bacillus oleivorans TaxID=1448271 RepID=A0A285D4R5_9BACI|nr:phosphotransferase [Bacillus oleivorans]SNX74790.1 Ser/Thr protein kinase RdoA (MazF antagonist) [Bacillus oleivorans]
MNIFDISTICGYWGIQIKDTKNLSEKALLLITSSDEKFVLKVKGDVKKTENENNLLDYIKSNGMNVPLPVLNKYGETIVNHNNINYCLYYFIEGETLSAADSLKYPSIPALLGEALAFLHIIMEKAEVSNFIEKNLYKLVSEIALNEILKVDTCEDVQVILNTISEEFQKRIESLPKQLIHRDAHIFNFIFKGHELSGFIDFEITEVNVRILDLCYCCTSVLNEVFSDLSAREDWFRFVKEILHQYNQINPLTDYEKNSVWHVMLCIQLIFMAYFSNNRLLYESNKAMFMWIYENKERLAGDVFLLK